MSCIDTYRGLLQLNKRGFTVLELLVVLAIIGLLTSIVYAPFNEARKKGRDGKRIAEMKTIQAALLIYSDDHGGCYPVIHMTALQSLYPHYLDARLDNNNNMHSKLHWSFDDINTVNDEIPIPEYSGVLGTPWTAERVYFYRPVGDDGTCRQQSQILGVSNLAPGYQLYTELESWNEALANDADSDYSDIQVAFWGGLLNGINLRLSSLESCDGYKVGEWHCVYDVTN